jgi:hypothetical protein
MVLGTSPTIASPAINGTVTTTGLTLPALILSGNVTSTGNPSLNIGSGALTAGATGVTTLTASSTGTFGGTTPTAGRLQSVAAAAGVSLALSDNTNNSLYVKHTAGNAVIGTDAGGGITIGTNGFTPAITISSAQAVSMGATGVTTLTAIKATAGDSGIFTNGAASNKSLYIYTDAIYSGIFSIAGAAGGANAYYWDNTTDTHHWQLNGLGSRMNLTSTGLAVTGALSATGNGAFGAATDANFRLYSVGSDNTGSNYGLVVRSANLTNTLVVSNSGAVTIPGTLGVTGAVAIGNTVASAVAVASTHKVTIVIGGVTYYLLASNV